MMSKKDQRSLTQRNAYHSLTTEINDFVFKQYGYHYLKPGETASQWCRSVPYMPELAEELKKIIQNFLNIRIINPSEAKDPHVIKGIITDIAYYLSRYTMKKADGICRNQATKALEEELIAGNAVMQGRLKTTRQEKKQRKRIISARDRRNHGQIANMFDMATHLTANYGRGR